MIKIICVGKIKEEYLNSLINDYYKRVNKYHKLEILELKDTDIIKESFEIKKHINKNDYIILLDILGRKVSSVEFSNTIETLLTNGMSNITFIIGSSFGVDDEIKKIANDKISFSSLTFPHGLFRGMLLEQIYRAFKIINNETYHK